MTNTRKRSGIRRPRSRLVRRLLLVTLLLGAVASWPIVLMIATGQRGAHGPFDAAVVFGARVYADGTPSKALEDRVLAAAAFYRDGRCTAVIMSGGPGDGATHETEAMRDLAVAHGVPEHAIVLDREGLNTCATCANAAEICRRLGYTRVAGVTHFYHTPRVGMALRRSGLDADTEPAPMRGRVLRGLPYFMARESAAWWVYLFRG